MYLSEDISRTFFKVYTVHFLKMYNVHVRRYWMILQCTFMKIYYVPFWRLLMYILKVLN